MQKVHGLIMKAMMAITEAMSDLKKIGQLNQQLGEVLKKGLDGLVLLVTAVRELKFRRRQLLRPSLNWDYAHLCLANTPITVLSRFIYPGESQSYSY